MPLAARFSSSSGTISPSVLQVQHSICARFAVGGYRGINLFFARIGAYIQFCRRESTMAINGLRNKPFGPGGGTRRLHPRDQGTEIRSRFLITDRTPEVGAK